jgi:hypothetical protein
MSNFSQDQGNQGITRPARRREQVIPQIDAEIRAISGWKPVRLNMHIAGHWNLTFFGKKNALL